MKPGSRTYNTNRRCGADTNVTRSENQWKAVNTVSYIHRRRWLCFSWGSGGDLPPPLLLFFHSAAACSTRHRHFLQRVNWLSHQLHLTSPRTRRSLNQIPAVLLTCRLSSTSPYNGVEKRHQLYQSVAKRCKATNFIWVIAFWRHFAFTRRPNVESQYISPFDRLWYPVSQVAPVGSIKPKIDLQHHTLYFTIIIDRLISQRYEFSVTLNIFRGYACQLNDHQ